MIPRGIIEIGNNPNVLPVLINPINIYKKRSKLKIIFTVLWYLPLNYIV
jgi:hypothetical protein